jgi:hypothetical protein
MIPITTVCTGRCVRGLVQLVEQVPFRLAARPSLVPNESSVDALSLWTLLRWERTFLLRALEDMDVDVCALAYDVDELLDEMCRPAGDHPTAASDGQSENHFLVWEEYGPTFPAGRTGQSPSYFPAAPNPSLVVQADLRRHMAALLDRAGRESRAMQHGFLGTEHLLLAILSGADARLSSILSSHGVTHERVKAAVMDLLNQIPVIEATLVEDDQVSAQRLYGAAARQQGEEAVGVPRRFGMGILILLVSLFAVLFAVMKMMGVDPITFVVTTVLFAGVATGQVLLFGGKKPRAASVWVGAGLFPVEMLAVLVGSAIAPSILSLTKIEQESVELLLIFSIPLGAGFGYLAGGLTAGAFVFIERYKKHQKNLTQKVKEDTSTEME